MTYLLEREENQSLIDVKSEFSTYVFPLGLASRKPLWRQSPHLDILKYIQSPTRSFLYFVNFSAPIFIILLALPYSHLLSKCPHNDDIIWGFYCSIRPVQWAIIHLKDVLIHYNYLRIFQIINVLLSRSKKSWQRCSYQKSTCRYVAIYLASEYMS